MTPLASMRTMPQVTTQKRHQKEDVGNHFVDDYFWKTARMRRAHAPSPSTSPLREADSAVHHHSIQQDAHSQRHSWNGICILVLYKCWIEKINHGCLSTWSTMYDSSLYDPLTHHSMTMVWYGGYNARPWRQMFRDRHQKPPGPLERATPIR